MSRRSIEMLIEDLWEAVGKIERYTNGLAHDGFVQKAKDCLGQKAKPQA